MRWVAVRVWLGTEARSKGGAHSTRPSYSQLKDIIAGQKTAGSQSEHFKRLDMELNGVIDAAVQGGTDKYREAFFSESYIKE